MQSSRRVARAEKGFLNPGEREESCRVVKALGGLGFRGLGFRGFRSQGV